MRILHISHRDTGGGAAIAAARMHIALRENGIESEMLVSRKLLPSPFVHQVSSGAKHWLWEFKKKISRGLELLQQNREGNFHSLNLFGDRILPAIEKLNPDIVHLHWVGGEMALIEDLAMINRPIVWTFHDMWPICGAEHLVLGLQKERIINGYSIANRDYAIKGIDWNRLIWERKYRNWKGCRMTAICLSKWQERLVRKSALFKAEAFGPVILIPNGIPTVRFYPDESLHVRNRFSLPEDNPILLFGAHLSENRTKGLDLLKQVLLYTDLPPETMLVSFGKGRPFFPKKIRHKHLGPVNDENSLRELYSAATLTLVPSRMESFGLVAAESLACGTPVVCFETSGITDVVKHKMNGYCADAFNCMDFGEGIQWCLSDRARYKSLSLNGINKVRNEFSMDAVVQRYIKLYSSICRNG